MVSESVLVPCKRAKLQEEKIEVNHEVAEGRTLNLPPDHISELILMKLKPFSISYFRFGCVCKQWFSILMENRQRRRQNNTHQLVPMMLFPISCQDNGVVKVIENRLLSISQKEFTEVVTLRVANESATDDDFVNYCGSTHGWLCYFQKSCKIVLYNPFAAVDNMIYLPPIMKAFDKKPCDNKEYLRWLEFKLSKNNSKNKYSVTKVVLSADPRTTDDYLVVAIYSNLYKLAFLKSSHNNARSSSIGSFQFPSWTFFDENKGTGLFHDVVFHKGLVWACSSLCVIVIKVDSVDNSDRLCVLQVVGKIDIPTIDRPSQIAWYLTKTTTTKQVLLVVKQVQSKSDDSRFNKTFQVLKLTKKHGEETMQWVNVTSLDGDAVFIGLNHTISIVATNSTECQPDSIYFIDDNPYGFVRRYYTGVFSLTDRTMRLVVTL